MVKANYKQLKAILVSRVKNFGPVFVVPKLGEFSLCDNFFSDLTNIWDLDNFLNFLTIFLSQLISNLLISSSLTPSRLGIYFSGGTIIFSIEVNKAILLLKP